MNSMTSKSAFNDHIQDKSKPAPASKAAALFEQPVKATKKPSIGTKKPARDINRSPATPADAYRKMQERAVGNIPERKGENIRLAPRHDFGSPSPVTRAGGNRLQHDNASIHTDGMETAATFDSGDIGTQDSGDAGIKTSHGSTSTQEDSAAKVQEQHNSNGLGVTVPPPVGQVDHEDLILLDQGVEQTQAPANISDTGPGGPSKINSGPSSDVPHIMDEDLDVELPPPTLTPKSHVAPRTLTFRGARYLREDTVPPFARPENQMNPFGGMYNRVALTEGVNIGLRTLQENSTGSILGEQNLPGQARRGSGASSIAGLATSRWGIKNVKSGIPETNLLDQSMFKTSAIPRTFSPIWEHDKYSSRKAETSDAPKTDIPAAPPATQERAPALNPGSSKYATQDRIVATSHKLSVEPEKRPHSAEPSAVESVRKDSSPSITSPRDREDKIVTTSKVANNHQSMYFNPSLKTDDLPFDRLSQNAANSTLVAPKPVRKTANLAASKWGSPDAKIITSTLAKMVGDKIPSSKSTENGGKNLGSAPMSKQGELRKRNPFESDTQPAPQISAVVDRHLVPTEAAQAERVPGMVRQFGNNQAENHAPRTIDERRIRFMGSALPVVGSDSRASPSMSETSAAASIEPAKPLVESRWANNGVENKSNGSRSSQTKTKPVANLMASKYAASTSSFSSFRKVRQIKDDSSSDESEI